MKDLLVVVPDKTWALVLDALLNRAEAIGVRPISWATATPPGLDSGVRVRGVGVAAAVSRIFRRALLVFDYEGCGDTRQVGEIEEDLRKHLKHHWQDRADVVIVTPEIEAWLWRAFPQIGKQIDLSAIEVKQKLRAKDFMGASDTKPSRPKEAFVWLLREARKVRSAAVYAEIARTASLKVEGCRTESFPRFVSLLRKWFPQVAQEGAGAS